MTCQVNHQNIGGFGFGSHIAKCFEQVVFIGIKGIFDFFGGEQCHVCPFSAKQAMGADIQRLRHIHGIFGSKAQVNFIAVVFGNTCHNSPQSGWFDFGFGRRFVNDSDISTGKIAIGIECLDFDDVIISWNQVGMIADIHRQFHFIGIGICIGISDIRGDFFVINIYNRFSNAATTILKTDS